MKRSAKTALLIAGPAVFIAATLTLSAVIGRSEAQAIGLLLWMVLWWITRPVNLAVTALLPFIVNALCGIVPMEAVVKNFFSEGIILLFGAGLVTMPWAKTGLDRRIALKLLSMIGLSMKVQIAVWFALSALFSTVLPNIVVCILLTQLAVLMLRTVGCEDISKSKEAVPILLSICWGVALGGVLTPLGGAQNIISLDIYEEFFRTEFMYLDWFIAILPYYIIACLFLLLCIYLIPSQIKRLDGSKEYFQRSYQELGPIKRDEKICAVLFLITIVVIFARPWLAKLLPSMTPAYCLLALGCLNFVLHSSDDQTPFITWQEVHSGTSWGLLCLCGGGAALGVTIAQSGITDIVLDWAQHISLDGGLTTIVFLVVITRVLAELADSLAAAAIMTPIALQFAVDAGLNPTPYFFIIIMAYSENFILPLSPRAVSVGSGLDAKKMMCYGIPISAATSVVVILIGYFLMQFWPPFSSLLYTG